jgi:hypothetical protein
MREVDILMDLLSYMETSQVLYNENIIEIRNPEARQLFTLLRDDEMRAVEMLQQKIERFESEKGIIAKMFPNRKRLWREAKILEWIILFIVSWVIFILLVKWKELGINVWGGVLAAILQLAVDTNAMNHTLYKVHNGVVDVLGSSLFFVLGPVFVVGTLLAQNHPYSKKKTIVNVLVTSLLYTVQEIALLSRKVLEYVNWNLLDSAVVNTSAMIMLSWFSIVVLDRMRRDQH